MKKKFQIQLVVMLTMVVANVNANIWRINNNDNTANFKDIQEAHDDAKVMNGDTLYIEGSYIEYFALICTKKLSIVGPGYYLDVNRKTAESLSATIKQITFNKGSEGSAVIGAIVTNMYVLTDYISVLRCNSGYIRLGDVEATKIEQSYISGILNHGVGISKSTYVNNNIIGGGITLNNNSMVESFNNNILLSSTYKFKTNHFRNNIITRTLTSWNVTSRYIQNNISLFDLQGTQNLKVGDIDALFVGGNNLESRYRLSENSQAKNFGFDGTDCGIFGGETPYVLSGLPTIPIIKELDVDDEVNTGSGLRVKMTVAVQQ